uniref:Integrase zinc-binding domain-containing protein n=1 Tax=Nothobranchius kadleci TaxID=1051664 RepID=A0A1A8CSF3_NOTKA
MDIVKGKENTKRGVLQTSSRIFDPIGFLTPFTIRAKCLFQEMWESGLKWDEQLPPKLKEKWEQWCAELPLLHLVVIPRWHHIEHPDSQNVSLQVYCDASEKAYSAVAYLKGKNREGETVTSFVASKSRVAPLKKMTLPRLDFMGALIGARLGHSLLKAFDLERNQLHMWTDSMITLHWIHSSAQRWKPFVANRVTEIQELTNPELWSHCMGKTNPADLPTRGQHVQSLIDSQLWWSGPKSLPAANEREQVDENYVSTEVNCELKTKHQVVVQLTHAEQVEPLFDIEKYSRLRTVLRVTAWVKRFVTNTRSSQKLKGELTADEIRAAERYWVKQTQESSFSSEILQLQLKQNVKRDSKIKDLKPFLDEEGLICVGGRLQNSDLSFREQHPWVLPSSHKYSELLVRSCHERVMHSGVRDTLIQVREQYWILRGRQFVKRIVSGCFICRKLKVKAAQQITAPLPQDRVTESAAFEVTGVDYAGTCTMM